MNETRLAVCAAVLVPLSAVIIAVFSRAENASVHAEVVVRLQVVMGLLALVHLGGFFARRHSGRPMASWVADVAAVVVVLYGAGISLSGTRVGGNMSTFPAALFLVSALLRPSRGAGLLAFFAVPAVVIAGVLALHGPSGRSVVWVATAVGLALVTWVTNRVLLVSHARDAHQRAIIESQQQKLATLNRELESRVEGQVAEIRARAAEIERLNEHLGQQVKDRTEALRRALRQVAEAVTPIDPGTVFEDRIVISSVLGRGGMGTVYRGHDRVLGKDVALKLSTRSECCSSSWRGA